MFCAGGMIRRVLRFCVPVAARDADMDRTKEQMKEADVICVVYAVNNANSRDNLRRRWLDVIVHELRLTVRLILLKLCFWCWCCCL